MGFMISPVDIEAVVSCKKHAIERVLLLIQAKIGEYQQVLASGPQEPDVPAVPSPKAVPAKKQPQAAPPARQQAPPQQQQQHQSPPRKAAPQQPQQQAPQAGNGKQQQQSSGPVSKDTQIHELQETVDILQLKVQKLEQLLRLKNSKIDSLTKKMAELTGGQ
jgi:hypothetical protein